MTPSHRRISKTGLLVAMAYPAIFVVLYFTLMLHLRFGLGRWPAHISDNPQTSLFHAHEVATGLAFAIGVILMPVSSVVALALAAISRARPFAKGLAIFASGLLLAYAAMHLAPASFIDWWWD